MKSKLKKIIILFIGLALAFSLNNTLINNNGAQTELDIPKQSAGYTESFIHVDGNWTATTANTWCYGSGTWQEPYVIENVTIDASTSPIGSGILISNSQNAYFIIRNCTVTNVNGATGYLNYEGGIKLINCSNGIVYNNTCADGGTYGCGILVYAASFNITISDNIVRNHGRHGIFGADSSNNLTITDNKVSDVTWDGIYLYNGGINNTIRNNTATNIGRYGIYLYDSDNNTILGNNASGNHDGIYLYASDNNTIQGNIANDNADEGIDLNQYCDYNRVIGNIANNNTSEGIQVYLESDFNIISGNNVSNNNNGIRIFSNCRYNTILNNNASYNKNSGIYLNSNSNDNNITENIVNENNQHGIYLDTSDSNTIINNTVNDNTDKGINLYNSDYNVIKNNTINRNELGIGLRYGDYNNITDNTLKDNAFCLFESWCTGNLIENNDCSASTLQAPIFIDGFATGAGAHNWTWAETQDWCKGSGIFGDPYIIENLEINGFELATGIEIINSNVSFIIRGCLIYNSDTGIYLDNVNNSRLINNNCSNNSMYGIYLYGYCSNNTISGNTANYNHEGISLDSYCSNNTISGNTANYNHEGIYLSSYCSNNTISGNTASNNTYTGIYLYHNDHNTISGNTANYNDDYGMYLDKCDINTISGNIANGNGFVGIHLNGECDNNTISGNTASNNDHSGIYFDGNDRFNIISGNTASNNTYTGIHLESANNDYNSISGNTLSESQYGINIGNSANNTIYGNFFLANEIHAMDNGTDNKWNCTTIGNYWDNWTSPDTTPLDGIVDDPYIYIAGSTGNTDYLPIAEDGAPSITINSPSDDDVFGSNAPNYDVIITDDYLFEMWYTLDGGLHNYTFTGSTGTIDQTAWDALSDGTITLTFYASDIPRNIGSADVNIVKDATGPIIVVNSPSSGSEFGVSAPSFSITITDDHLDSVWYSLDGGLTTYTITTNATIDQTAWTALSVGSITITFYANDTLGNEASKEVIITKTIAPAADDPTIVIVIVVVSIVGGVAVLAGVYIFMKKRTTP